MPAGGSPTTRRRHQTTKAPSSSCIIVVKSVRLVVCAARVRSVSLSLVSCSDACLLRMQRRTPSPSLTSSSRSSPKLFGNYHLLPPCTGHNVNCLSVMCAPTSRSSSRPSRSSLCRSSTLTSKAFRIILHI